MVIERSVLPVEGGCPFCLRFRPKSEMTKEHIIASAWYPDTTPTDVQRATVKSCKECNARYAPLEEEALYGLSLCVDPMHPASAGIYEKTKRAIDPSFARDPKDFERRKNLRKRLIASLIRVEKLPPHALPISKRNFEVGSRTAIPIPATLDRVVEKWVRGFHYKRTRRFIHPHEQIEIYHVSNEHAGIALKDLVSKLTILQHGPSVEVILAIGDTESGQIGLYGFNIWRQFRVFASTAPKHL